MYMNFYNMSKAPFHITPDPDFLFLSPSHKEALGALIYCIEERKGFVSVIGEVGTGKTTIIRSYLAKSDKSRVRPIYVFNPAVCFAELLNTIFQELGVTVQSGSTYEMVQQLNTVLIEEYSQDRNIVLIIDEAQNMPITTFEELRVLSNLETAKDKLLQIILVGQPELGEKLARRELRALNQRLAIRATLMPLSPKESGDYILFRLSQVTPSPNDIFTPGALKKIIRTAEGSPRKLNILCDNALIAGFGYQSAQITKSIAKQVISDFEGQKVQPFFTWKYAACAGVLLLFAALLQFSSLSTVTEYWMAEKVASEQTAMPAVAETNNERSVDKAVPKVVETQHKRSVKKAVPAVVAIKNGSMQETTPAVVNSNPSPPVTQPVDKQVGSTVVSPPAQPISQLVLTTANDNLLHTENTTPQTEVKEKEKHPDPLLAAAIMPAAGRPQDILQGEWLEDADIKESPVASTPERADIFHDAPAAVKSLEDKPVVSELSSFMTKPDSINDAGHLSQISKKTVSTLKTRQVRKGEYLSQICLEVYGFVNDQLIEAVRKKNPQIFDADLIFIGDKISFPEVSYPEKTKTYSQGG